jgi:hypothetical protein
VCVGVGGLVGVGACLLGLPGLVHCLQHHSDRRHCQTAQGSRSLFTRVVGWRLVGTG